MGKMMNCPTCNKSISTNAKVCPNCGEIITESIKKKTTNKEKLNSILAIIIIMLLTYTYFFTDLWTKTSH